MKLSPKHRQQAAKLLSVAKPCRLCGGSEIICSEALLALVSYETDASNEPAMMPVAVTLCRSCKHMALFSAGDLDLIDDERAPRLLN